MDQRKGQNVRKKQSNKSKKRRNKSRKEDGKKEFKCTYNCDELCADNNMNTCSFISDLNMKYECIVRSSL